MGRTEIIEKINSEFEKGIIEECQVVFIMSRIRKVLEIKKEKEKYKYLNFYGNWVLHDRLENKNVLTGIFEQTIDCEKGSKENAKALKSTHKEFFVFHTIKQELDKFFKANDLPIEYLNKNWRSFLKYLLEIIKECPIIFHSIKIRQLELIKNNKGEYCYKFDLVGTRDKPIIKLKLK